MACKGSSFFFFFGMIQSVLTSSFPPSPPRPSRSNNCPLRFTRRQTLGGKRCADPNAAADKRCVAEQGRAGQHPLHHDAMPIKKGTSIKAGSKEWSSIKRAASARPSRDTHMTPTASRGDSLAEPAIEDFGVFRAKLLGSVTVDAATDAGVVVAATTKIKKDKGHDPRKVYLNVTSSELQVLDQSSNDVIQTSDVGQVIFFAIHPKDKKTLCYITKSKYVAA